MFIDRLLDGIQQRGTPICVGLDPSLPLMPAAFRERHPIDEGRATSCADAIAAYCDMVLDAVADLVAVVKPQSAYFEVYGAAGIAALERTMASARERGLLVVLDAKRGDIGSTSEAYAAAYLSGRPDRPLDADALTVSPYLGDDALEPFVTAATAAGKGLFVLARTSNAGGAVLQERVVDGKPLYELVADMVRPWSDAAVGAKGYSGIGVVAGATNVGPAAALRAALPRSLFLVPGVGAQGGSHDAVRACFDDDGLGAIVNVSRAVMYPEHHGGSATADPGADIRAAAERQIAAVRSILG